MFVNFSSVKRFFSSTPQEKKVSEPKKKMEMKALSLVARSRRLNERLQEIKQGNTNVSVEQLINTYVEQLEEQKLFLPRVKQYFSSIQHSLIPNNHLAILEIYYFESLLDEIDAWISTLEH